MATTYKIHPAVGITRVGNSPDDFFIGPELLGQDVTPQGGLKDNQCRLKRQAARFRISRTMMMEHSKKLQVQAQK